MVYPDFITVDSIFCGQTQVDFFDISTSSHPITNWKWQIEDTASNFYVEVQDQNTNQNLPFGNYKVTLTTYIGGCEFDTVKNSEIQVYALPTAAFEAFKDTVDLLEELWFTNTSIPEANSMFPIYYKWNFGDDSPEKTTVDAKHAFMRPGNYEVRLSAYENEHCEDVAAKTIFVRYEVRIPNVFTPNGDGVNDRYLEDMDLKNIIILNRWGQVMYEGTDGWDGRINGVEATPGTYFYIITTLIDEVYKGALTLLRN
jgi:gliding motility-associated-like protein